MFLMFDSSTPDDLDKINCNDTGCWVNHDILFSGQSICFQRLLSLFHRARTILVTYMQLLTKNVVKFTRLIDA
jgi:hypothetical protein